MRLPGLDRRPYQSIFGAFELPRAAYGTREGQKIEFVPLDQRPQLPESKFSYVLQDWDQRLIVETPYTEANATVQKILEFSQSVDSLERMNRKMAQLVVDYWDWLETPPTSEEGELMVVSADGKGVPIRGQRCLAPSSGEATFSALQQLLGRHLAPQYRLAWPASGSRSKGCRHGSAGWPGESSGCGAPRLGPARVHRRIDAGYGRAHAGHSRFTEARSDCS